MNNNLVQQVYYATRPVGANSFTASEFIASYVEHYFSDFMLFVTSDNKPTLAYAEFADAAEIVVAQRSGDWTTKNLVNQSGAALAVDANGRAYVFTHDDGELSEYVESCTH